VTWLRETYAEQIHTLTQLWPENQSLEVSYRIIEGLDHDFAQNILAHPEANFQSANRALNQILLDTGYGNLQPFVRIHDLPSTQIRPISDIRAHDIGVFISLDTVVTKITGVRPRLYRATFVCDTCGHPTVVEQYNEQELVQPLTCSGVDGGCNREGRQTRFTLHHQHSILINTQFVELQELPESMRGGLQPSRLMCIAEQDLTGRVTPGDRVKANGVLFIRSQRKSGKQTPLFDYFFNIHSLEHHSVALEEIKVTDAEEIEIKEIASNPNIFDILKASIAPSIFGLNHVKESLALQLFGGVPGLNKDSTRIRGDIHILLMGDPGVAKSQLLSYMAKISPRGRFTSGQSASAAGLTAAAVQDASADGRWTLEAGALVLADMGLAAVDEFDKMSPGDRASMHEAMEQQRISIAKAGINATLSTRCAVLAAANPKDGRFKPTSEVPFVRQIDLEPPLLSRFDLIWLLTDTPNFDSDTRIANHILQNRRNSVSEILVKEGSMPDPTKSTLFDESESKSDNGFQSLHKDFLRKYVAYAKRNIHPKMPLELFEEFISFYVEKRQEKGQAEDSIGMTARDIEAISRLAEASARIRLSKNIDREDMDRATRLFRHSRDESIGGDLTTLESGKKPTTRNREQSLMEIIQKIVIDDETGFASRETVHLEAKRIDIDTEQADQIIQKLVNAGRLYLPSGYDTIGLA
jgi:replicative DNA helicase Mcm